MTGAVRRLSAALVIVGMLAFILASCKTPERKSRVTYDYFDTGATLYSYSGDKDEVFDANFRAFETELRLCHELFDIYNEYDGINNAATVNENAGKSPVRVDGRLIDLLLFSKEMHQKTGGAVNVAMGAVLGIWHACREARAGVPTDEELSLAAEHCDIDDVIIDEAASTVYLADPKMSLDLGAVAKGYAIDRAAAVLRARGAVSYAIDVGGNLYAIGAKHDGSAFKTGIESPDDGDYPAYIDVRDGSVATSGDYQRFYTVGGVSYHHIIDPVTLYPIYLHRSVSVYSPSAALSDALSTALFNLDREAGETMIRASFPEVREVIYIGDYGVLRFSQ